MFRKLFMLYVICDVMWYVVIIGYKGYYMQLLFVYWFLLGRIKMRNRRVKRRNNYRRKFFILLAMFSSSSELLCETVNRQHRISVKQWLQEMDSRSSYFNYLQELRMQDKENYRKYLRMLILFSSYSNNETNNCYAKAGRVCRKGKLAIT